MRISKLVVAAAFAALSAVSLQAQYFSSMYAPTGAYGPAFWDKVSSDGPKCNIGYVLTGQTNPASTCSADFMLPSPTTFPAPYAPTVPASAWYAHDFGTPGTSVGFGFFGAATVTYYGGIAGASPLKRLAIRDVTTGTILHEFMRDTASTWTFAVGSGFLWDIGIETYSPPTPLGTPNRFSWTGSSASQFAAFGNGATSGGGASCGSLGCWVGAEDIDVSGGDRDFNDGVLRVEGAGFITNVPEPASILLVASGLLGLAVTARKRKSVNA